MAWRSSVSGVFVVYRGVLGTGDWWCGRDEETVVANRGVIVKVLSSRMQIMLQDTVEISHVG